MIIDTKNIGCIILQMFPKASINYLRGDDQKGLYTISEQYDTIEWIDTFNPENPDNLISKGIHENPTIENRPTLVEIEAKRLELVKVSRCERVDSICTEKLEAAIVSYNNDQYKINKDARIFIHGAANNGDKTRTYADKDKNQKSLSKTDFVNLSALCLDCEEAHETRKRELHSAINISSDPESISINSGWPANPFTGE